MRKVRIHKDCGGRIKNNKCSKCEEKFGKTRRLFSMGFEDTEVPENKFSERGYRRRIREGRDIPKGGKK